MANPNAIVAAVNRLSPSIQGWADGFMAAAPEGLQIHFEDGRTARLNAGDARAAVYAELLDELRRMIVLAYVEVDPATNMVNPACSVR